MCDYSLQAVAQRPAVVGEKIQTNDFGTGTTGFCPAGGNLALAVCLLPGTEVAFDAPITGKFDPDGKYNGEVVARDGDRPVARFRQINREHPSMHHDALEFPGGQVVLVHMLRPGQVATVLQLPAAPRSDAEREEQRRVETVG